MLFDSRKCMKMRLRHAELVWGTERRGEEREGELRKGKRGVSEDGEKGKGNGGKGEVGMEVEGRSNPPSKKYGYGLATSE